MAKKQMLFKTKGMNRDLSVSAFNPEFAFENMNLRLSTNEGNTLMSWVNEKGTASIELVNGKWKDTDNTTTGITSILGTPIGTAILNNKLVLFTTSTHEEIVNNETTTVNDDCIYVFKYQDAAKTKMLGKLLYRGNLNFSTDHPLETLVSYEAEDIQKVYWVDHLNQPRLINIENVRYSEDYDSQFDFIAELQLNETVKVKKMLGANGTFAPGVIQYAFTYYNNHGQESNIFYTTPLYYISHKDRGGSPEEKVANAFKITVSNLDMHFDYLRIYSIQRTSINGTPICKRIQDISLNGLTGIHEDPEDETSPVYYEASYTDNGTSGNSVDPTELLYKGGENIIAKTLEQKDNTLFLGNIGISRAYINDSTLIGNIKANSNVQKSLRKIYPTVVSTSPYVYNSQLTAFDSTSNDNSVPCGGFKHGDYYRLGVQFQYKTGKWSDPICIKDHEQMIGNDMHPQETFPVNNSPYVELPVFTANIRPEDANTLLSLGYRKVRPVMVVPQMQDRNVLCQGVVCPTLHTQSHEQEFQSSWFFRTRYPDEQYEHNTTHSGTYSDKNEGVIPGGFKYGEGDEEGSDDEIPYTSKETSTTYPIWNPIGIIKGVEIEGDFDPDNRFVVNNKNCSFYSPDIEFDTAFGSLPFTKVSIRNAGQSNILKTLGDIDIQTESPTISNLGTGFVHKDCIGNDMHGILAGAYYDDTAGDDGNGIHAENTMKTSAKWIIYPWQGTGSLNNDFNRPSNLGTQSAKLKKKIISNLRFSDITDWFDDDEPINSLNNDPQLFSSDEVTILKSGSNIYKGNIDTSLSPDHADGKYFVYDDGGVVGSDSDTHLTDTELAITTFNCENVWKTYSQKQDNDDEEGLYQYLWGESHKWKRMEKEPGETYLELVLQRNPIRMKYKSIPHLYINTGDTTPIVWDSDTALEPHDSDKVMIPVVEILRNFNEQEKAELYGGTSEDAYKENRWIPCGEPVKLENTNGTGGTQGTVNFEYSYGDTYFQRWDCLKTYAFTPEDINQVVEIGSFMLESHVNIDGRYDRNRGQQNNLNMSPRNFNLMNPVYSQQDNFFTYRIMDDEEYTRKNYPNQVTWTKTKESGADVDLWTNITLASVLEMDGDKGEINKLERLNDQLLCFQDTGISRILYNEQSQILAENGVNLEIANSGKVTGKIYLSNTIGCSNKWSMVTTPAGIYFMDSNDKSIYRFGEGLQNMSLQGGMNSWCKQNIPDGSKDWDPVNFNNFRSYYDKLNQDVLFVNKEKALAYSEKFNTFTSFYDYGGGTAFVNLEDTGVWITKNLIEQEQIKYSLWKHQAGEYGVFFGAENPYWMTLVGNPEPQMDKIFTNLEFRACVTGDGTLDESDKFTFSLPFDSVETWNEYQHGYTGLSNRNGHDLFRHGGDNSSLIRKFRIWRCDIPRNNCNLGEPGADEIWPYSTDAELGVSRHIRKPQDRMRNPWVYIKLFKNTNWKEVTYEYEDSETVKGSVVLMREFGPILINSHADIAILGKASGTNFKLKVRFGDDEQFYDYGMTELNIPQIPYNMSSSDIETLIAAALEYYHTQSEAATRMEVRFEGSGNDTADLLLGFKSDDGSVEVPGLLKSEMHDVMLTYFD